MELGLFLMPTHPPERSLYDATQWDLEMIELADQLGYTEAWVGEHFTAAWEPIPAPDLLLAQALLRTKQIKLAPGAHLLPYHHPAELAHRVAYLDHLAQGRFMFGVGASGLPSDWALFDVDGFNGQNRDMTREALEIILKLWTEEEPFEYRGKYWSVNSTGPMFGTLGPHVRPYQRPYPPIGITGLSPKSETLVMAGERGFIPMSLGANAEYIASHWDSVVRGAEKSGRTVDRGIWRITRDVFVADTDEEARRWSLDSMMGRQQGEYLLPLFTALGAISIFKANPDDADDAVTPAYMAKNTWIVGSPDTVVEQLNALQARLGGFGTLLVVGYDYSEHPEPWRHSMRLLAEEVVPRLEHPALAAAV